MEHFSWYDQIPAFYSLNEWLRGLGILEEGQSSQHLVSYLLVFIFLTFVSVRVGKRYRNLESALVPPRQFGLTALFEFLVEKLYALVISIIGPHGAKHFPFLGAIFIIIFFNNLLGMIPGFPPATSTISTNLAMALSVFIYYNYRGFRTHGLGYLKHFAGPIIWLAPLMVPIELAGHIVRPVSLSLRLAGNITGDHMVLGVFTSMTYLIIPVVFLALGLFICLIQAFVFTLLSSIYIALAESHEH